MTSGTASASTGAELGERQAEAIAAACWGIDASARRLAGERDAVFRLVDRRGAAFVLKIAAAREDPAVTDLITQAMLHIEFVAPALPVERVVRTPSGEPQVRSGFAGGPARSARLTTFLAGRNIRAIEPGPQLRRQLGATAARLDLALAGFAHPCARRELEWDVLQLARLSGLLPELVDLPDRGALTELASELEAELLPRLRATRAQVTHNDFGSDNVLVDDAGADVAGIIDFGDLVETALVSEVAVAAAYQLGSDGDPLAGALEVIAGYHAFVPLEPLEIALLGDVIRARLVQRIVIPAWRASRAPENRAYLLRNADRCRTQLAALASLPAGELAGRIATACQTGAR